MNFRMLAAPAWPRGRVFALTAITALGATFLATDVWAQAPAPAPAAPAAPKAAPKAPRTYARGSQKRKVKKMARGQSKR